MAIGLLFEIAAAKAHLTLGQRCVVQAFRKSKKAYTNIGEALEEAGFNKYGSERFFSGTSGEELTADVFCGCAYYLRLHHFARDKFQVRSAGCEVDERTHQPENKGLSGAIKVGEMERDALVSHGASALMLDRLFINSDRCTVYLCTRCHQMICPSPPHPLPEFRSRNVRSFCELCSRDSDVQVQVPYVLVYLMAELAVVGIKLNFSVSEEGEGEKKCSPF